MNTRPLGFPRERRLLTPADYRRAFAEPSRSGDGCFTVLYSPNGLQHARLGLAISKKALRRAVHRNLVKRLVRESFRLHQGVLQGRDVVVLFRAGASVRDRKALHASLARHWRRVGHAGLPGAPAGRPDQTPAGGGTPADGEAGAAQA